MAFLGALQGRADRPNAAGGRGGIDASPDGRKTALLGDGWNVSESARRSQREGITLQAGIYHKGSLVVNYLLRVCTTQTKEGRVPLHA